MPQLGIKIHECVRNCNEKCNVYLCHHHPKWFSVTKKVIVLFFLILLALRICFKSLSCFPDFKCEEFGEYDATCENVRRSWYPSSFHCETIIYMSLFSYFPQSSLFCKYLVDGVFNIGLVPSSNGIWSEFMASAFTGLVSRRVHCKGLCWKKNCVRGRVRARAREIELLILQMSKWIQMNTNNFDSFVDIRIIRWWSSRMLFDYFIDYLPKNPSNISM